MLEGYKHFSKTKPMKLEHFQPVMDLIKNYQEHRRELNAEIDKVLEEITVRLNE